MTRAKARAKIITDRARWIRTMVSGIKTLPLGSIEEFTADRRNAAAAESFLRRAIEAVMDLGRHILSKGFGVAVVEYREIAVRLGETGVLDGEHARIVREMAGYRNRMVHFYNEIGVEELYQICTGRLGEIERVLDAILAWANAHPELVERE